jgi:sugar phosphate isomerase/epimerase
MSSRVGLMLYTLRDDCARDFEGTLRAVREIGYEGVELIDLYGHDAHEVRALLDSLGLAVCGRHASLDAIESDLDGLAAELRAVGSDRLVLAWIAPPATADEADAVVARIATLATRARDAGLRLGFHNHDGELRPLDDGRTVLDRLVELGEDELFFEVDLGWAWFGGVEPASLVEHLAPRVPLVHVKDLAPEAENIFVPVGAGDVGYRQLLPAIEGLGVEWLLVEQDEVEEPKLDAVRRSFEAVTDAVGTPA